MNLCDQLMHTLEFLLMRIANVLYRSRRIVQLPTITLNQTEVEVPVGRETFLL